MSSSAGSALRLSLSGGGAPALLEVRIAPSAAMSAHGPTSFFPSACSGAVYEGITQFLLFGTSKSMFSSPSAVYSKGREPRAR